MLSKALAWFLTTSTIVGVPVLLYIAVIGAQRALMTVTCETARYGCSKSFVQSVDWIAEAVTDETDVVVTPRKRK